MCPFDSNGVFSLTPGYLAVTGQTIQPTQHNPPLEDLAAQGLSQVLVRDGRAPMTGNLNMNGFKAVGLLAGSSGTDAVNKTQLDAVSSSITGTLPTYVTKAANYTALDADYNASMRFTAAATLAIDVTANLRTNWRIDVWADGGAVTIDPNSTNTINGALTLVLQQGQKAEIFKTSATTFQANVYADSLSGPQIQGYSTGLVLTTNVTDPTNDVDIAVGAAASDVSPYYLMQLTSAITKQIDATWVVGTNAGGLDTGAVGNNTYYIWLIQRSDTLVTDVLFSLSSTAPTMPTNYDRKRLLGSLVRTAGVNSAPSKPVSSTVPFRSPQLAITMSSNMTVAHGLGAVPARVNAKLVCLITNAGYAVGDEVALSTFWNTTGGAVLGADATNVWVTFPAVYPIFAKTTFGNTQITAASWRLVLEAWPQ